MKRSSLIFGALLWGMGAMAQTAQWNDKDWECKISENGCLEQIVFKGQYGNDTVPFSGKENTGDLRFM